MRHAGWRSVGCAALATVFWIGVAATTALAETASVIDPTEKLDPPKPAAQPDAALKRARAEAEQRRRAKAEARALAAKQQAAERESARLRAIEQAREAAARETARKAAAAQAAKAAAARAAEVREAIREAAAKELAARQAAARESAAKEAAAKAAAAKEAEAKEAAARAAAAREAADRLIAARQAAARERRIEFVAARPTAALISKEPVGTAFRDCAKCPELVWLPQGEFAMGDAPSANDQRPVVAIRYMLAVGRFEVTFAEWDACVAAGGCRRRPQDAGWGRGMQPVINVSWGDAQQYVAWLSRATNKRYRLLSEAEWEYAARAGTDVRYWWGDQAGRGDANCAECGSKWDGRQAAPVGRFAPNPFGLHDMHGNVSEWVEDCYHDRTYDRTRDAPLDGRPWTGGCTAATDTRIVRGGAWHGSARSVRSASRSFAASEHFDNGIGFRIARTE
jgi:formylglycine-generating enzyme required for sulfatase activity